MQNISYDAGLGYGFGAGVLGAATAYTLFKSTHNGLKIVLGSDSLGERASNLKKTFNPYEDLSIFQRVQSLATTVLGADSLHDRFASFGKSVAWTTLGVLPLLAADAVVFSFAAYHTDPETLEQAFAEAGFPQTMQPDTIYTICKVDSMVLDTVNSIRTQLAI